MQTKSFEGEHVKIPFELGYPVMRKRDFSSRLLCRKAMISKIGDWLSALDHSYSDSVSLEGGCSKAIAYLWGPLGLRLQCSRIHSQYDTRISCLDENYDIYRSFEIKVLDGIDFNVDSRTLFHR